MKPLSFRCTACLLLALISMPPVTLAASIDRIEPPSWWTGFADARLQLMVYGEEIARFEPSLEYPGVTIARTVRGSSANYLFVYLDVGPDARPGTLELTFTGATETLSFGYPLQARERDPHGLPTFSPADAIYLITPDRFANGDPANDAVAGYDDAPARDEPFGRHGGDLAGIREHLDYIAGMGFTQVWLNPVLENAMPESSYHGYATTDYYRVDPRYGSNEDYRELAGEARARGLGLIMDMIVNHIGSAHPWVADPPTRDWVHDADDIRITTHARTTQQDPYASDFDRRAFADGWFVDSMPDLDQENPLLADYLVQNAVWWIEYLGLAGIRQDTWPYADKTFLAEWARRIRAEYPRFNIVGEEWSPNPAVVSYWQAGKENHDRYVSHLPSLMDFPLQSALAESLTMDEPAWGSAWTRTYEMLGNDWLYPDPFNLVIFPDNHDMSRIATQLGDDPRRFRMAMAFYLTMRGIPQVYYGTEIMMSHPGTEHHGLIRSDFPGGWRGDAVNAFTGKGLDDSQRAAQEFVKKLLNWRKSADVVHGGKLMQFTPMGNVYVYFRYDEDDTLMVAFNRGGESETVDLARFAERIGSRRAATDVVSGRRYALDEALTLDPASVLVLELAD
ncbi:MAG TPA: glycoside hydrolase family 13 protein [Woeseiaceae bacterium]|nr:glycoside hydrolase family 13 protein [Woeseiaceae bacterium]